MRIVDARMRKARAGAALVSAAILLLAGAGSASGGEGTIEQARKERQVVWYTAMNVSDTEAVRKAFRGRYPFLSVTILRAPGEKVRTRILTEARASRFLWDVVSFNLLEIDSLNQEGLLAEYRSPETRTGYAPGAVDPGGRWAAIYVRQYVIGYNTKLVAAEQAPKDWPDLLAPQWSGQLALDESEVEWYGAMLEYWGREKGLRFMRALSRQNPQPRRGHSLLSRLLVAGEFPLALVLASEVDQEKRRGAPVEWVRSLDPIVTSASQIAIAARAPHPQAARLFVDFVLSREGQGIIASRGRVPARADSRGAVEPLKLHHVHPRLAREFERYEDEFREIFGRVR
jgi:iron(III) transport system substrate-binding protein